MLDLLDLLGAASVHLFWLPLLAWTLVWGLAEAGLRLGRGAHPAVRYRVVQATLLTLPLGLVLAATVDASALLPWQTPALAFVPDAGAASTVASEAALFVEEVGPSGLVSLAALLGAAVCIWALVAAARLLRLAGHAVALRRLRHALPPVHVIGLEFAVQDAAERVGLRRPVEIVATDADVVPMTFGLWRPLVVVPASLAGDDLRLALVHELVHVRQRDALGQWLETLVSAVFGVHPAVSRLTRECDLLREMTCDAAVLADPAVSRHSYAALVSTFVAPPAPAVSAAVGMADSPPHVHQRLTAMKSLNLSPAPVLTGWLLAAAVLVIGALSVTASRAFAQPTPTLLVRSVDGFATTPLLIVDGEVSEGSIGDLDADDIYSVEVLKGTTAEAQYGEAGAEGVVVITTRAAAEARGLPPQPVHDNARAIQDATGAATFAGVGEEDGAVRVRVLETSRRPSGEMPSQAEPSVITTRSTSPPPPPPPFADGKEPLYIVDGKLLDGPVRNLDPSSIESIDVLKGEAARAQHGEAAVNGVILITTKAGATASVETAAVQARAVTDDGYEFTVHSAYPNPSNGSVSVTFSLPSEAEVRLDVFDVTGRRVQGVQPVRTSAGPRQTLQVDTAGLATGTYTYRLTARTADQNYVGSGTFSVVG